jgi:Flp pilus assembly protein TadG
MHCEKGGAKMKNQVGSFLKRAKRSFIANDKGSVGIMAGLTMVGVCLAIGAGIDFGRVTSASSRLSAALDVAALHVAGMTGKSDADLKPIAEAVMLKNYGGNTYDQVSAFNLVSNGNFLKVSAKVTVKTWFMSIGGIHTMEVPLTTEAVKGGGGANVEVALVLDNTGSMDELAGSEKKIVALRTAANDFINTVIADPAGQTPYYSKAAIVPYAANVDPGGLLSQTRQADSSPCGTIWGCPTYKFNYPTNRTATYVQQPCVTERMGADALTDADITSSRAMYNYDQKCVGQVGDPGVALPNISPNGSSPVRLLTSNKADLKYTIDGMVPGAGTAGHIGIQWGYQMLSPRSNLASAAGDPKAKPGAYNDPKIKKIMIIMTDGLFNTWHCNGLANNARGGCNNANGDSFTQAKATCSNIKTSGIEIYFVGVGLPSDTDVNALTAVCSTDASHVIMASDSAALKAAFAQIAANLQSMRLSM